MTKRIDSPAVAVLALAAVLGLGRSSLPDGHLLAAQNTAVPANCRTYPTSAVNVAQSDGTTVTIAYSGTYDRSSNRTTYK